MIKGLTSATETAHKDLDAIMSGSNWRQKEAVCMVLHHAAMLTPGEHCTEMAQSIADYFVEVQAGRIT